MLSLPIALPDDARGARPEGHVVLPGRTYADFAALPEGTLAELFDGALVVSPAPTLRHQRIAARLFAALFRFVEEREAGAVFFSPVDVRLSPDIVLQPDIVFVAADRLHLLGKQEVEGAPGLVVEVLSPSTGAYDLTQKRRIYEEAGVREYWIVDPAEQTVEVLALTDGGYQTATRVRHKGMAGSALLAGFGVEAGALFADPRRA